MTGKGGGQDLGAMWKLHHVHWPLSSCNSAGRPYCRPSQWAGWPLQSKQCRRLRTGRKSYEDLWVNSIYSSSTISLLSIEVFNKSIIRANEDPPWRNGRTNEFWQTVNISQIFWQIYVLHFPSYIVSNVITSTSQDPRLTVVSPGTLTQTKKQKSNCHRHDTVQ